MESTARAVWLTAIIVSANLVYLGECNNVTKIEFNSVKDPQCKDGRYSHPTDCTKFLECIDGRLRERFCAKGAFDDKNKKCVSKIEGCRRSRRGKAYTATPHLDYLCENDVPFVCSDCNTLVQCIDGVAHSESCEGSDICMFRDNFIGAICYPDTYPECSCKYMEKIGINPYTDRTFLYCESDDSIPKSLPCPVHTSFDIDERRCLGEDGKPGCHKEGIFVNNQDCREYYECIRILDGHFQLTLQCGAGQMYNEHTGACEDPCQWGDGTFECSQEGRFSDPAQCNKYYECIEVVDGAFLKRPKYCPAGKHWSQLSETFGFCGNKYQSDCQEVQVPKCKIPDDMCSEIVVITETEDDTDDSVIDPQIETEELESTEGDIQEILIDTIPMEADGGLNTMVGGQQSELGMESDPQTVEVVTEYENQPGEMGMGNKNQPGEMGMGNQNKPGEMGIGNEYQPGEMGMGHENQPGEMGIGNEYQPGEIGIGNEYQPGEMGMEHENQPGETAIENEEQYAEIELGEIFPEENEVNLDEDHYTGVDYIAVDPSDGEETTETTMQPISDEENNVDTEFDDLSSLF